MRTQGCSYDAVRRRYKIGCSTIELIMHRFSEINKSLDELRSIDKKQVEELFYPPENLSNSSIPEPDWMAIHEARISGKTRTLTNLWLDYKKQHPDGYQKTQFFQKYKDFVNANFGMKNLRMAINRVPGERVFIDWVGDVPRVLLDLKTHELKGVYIFITTVGVSDKIYADTFTDERLENFLTGVNGALAFYGGVPKFLVPDNLKTAVTRHTKDDLILQASFEDLEEFYQTIVVPPPPRKPRGKPTVENAVLYVENRVIYQLEKGTYTSIEQVRKRVHEIVDELNAANFEKYPFSRNDLFEKYDKPMMRPLPGRPFAICDYKNITSIADNYHVEYDGHYYSVPYQQVHHPCLIKATASEIRITDVYNHLIAQHKRIYGDFPRYSTKDEHMPPEHLYEKGINEHDEGYYRSKASEIGPYTSRLIDAMFHRSKHPEQEYRSCAAVIYSIKKFPKGKIEEISRECVEMNSCTYSNFKMLLRKASSTPSENHDEGQNPEGSGQAEHTVKHENIRGAHYYS